MTWRISGCPCLGLGLWRQGETVSLPVAILITEKWKPPPCAQCRYTTFRFFWLLRNALGPITPSQGRVRIGAAGSSSPRHWPSMERLAKNIALVHLRFAAWLRGYTATRDFPAWCVLGLPMAWPMTMFSLQEIKPSTFDHKNPATCPVDRLDDTIRCLRWSDMARRAATTLPWGDATRQVSMSRPDSLEPGRKEAQWAGLISHAPTHLRVDR